MARPDFFKDINGKHRSRECRSGKHDDCPLEVVGDKDPLAYPPEDQTVHLRVPRRPRVLGRNYPHPNAVDFSIPRRDDLSNPPQTMLRFFARIAATMQYVFRQEMEAETNLLHAGLASRLAIEKRDTAARFTKVGDSMDAGIKEVEDREDKGF
jgi:hypothetical protein